MNMQKLPFRKQFSPIRICWRVFSSNKSIEGAQNGVQPFEKIPGPKPLPIVGNVWRFLPFVGEYYGVEIQEMHRMIYKKYGSIARFSGLLGQPDLIFVYRPEDIETTFRNEGPYPIRRGLQAMAYYRNNLRKEFYTDGIGVLVEDGPKWLETRSKANQPMMQPRTSKRYIQPIGNVAQEFIEQIYRIRDKEDEMPADFINELFKWSLESIACVALDTRLGCLVPNLPRDSEPQRMIDAVGTFFDCSFYLEIGPPIWKIFPTPTWKRFVKALDVFLEVSNRYVEEAMQRLKQRNLGVGNSDGEESVLEKLLGRGDAKFASVMAQDMMFGGVDSTSYSIAVAMYHLAKNQDKQDILFHDVKRLLPSKDTVITEQILEEMKYLKACLKESTRISPITSGNIRFTVQEIVLSNYRVPKDVGILMPFTISCDSENIFPLPRRYIPERWLKFRPTNSTAGSVEDFDSVKKGKSQPFAFLPFGFGPRSCVGKRFADLEMSILLAKLVRNFQIEYHYGDMRFQSRILNTPKDPLRFKLIERKE